MPKPATLLYYLVDGLVDSFFPVLEDLDDRIDTLQEDMATSPREEQLTEMLQLKHRLADLRRVIAPQRDLFGRLLGGAETLPGTSTELEREFRDVYDHLARLGEEIDLHRDLLTSTMDVYLSTVSNRLNAVMKQLTVIATIFLPLTFLTGFFGQNFRWMVDAIGGKAEFFGLGVGLELLAVVALLAMFKKRHWF